MSEIPDRGQGGSVSHAQNDVVEAQPLLTGAMRTRRVTALLLFLGAVGMVASFLIGFFALGLSEDSAAESFEAYRQHSLPIFLTFYGGMLAGVLLILAAPLLYLSFATRRSPWLRVAATCQALAGLMLALSASRWLVVLPILQKQYSDGNASAATRAAIDVAYETISYFLGITLGEHLFAILIGVSTLIWATHVVRFSPRRRWIGRLGMVGGIGWLLGSIEQLDLDLAQYFIVFLPVGAIVWVIWTALLGRELARSTRDVTTSRATG
jgi:uncharacterized protein DUF4386